MENVISEKIENILKKIRESRKMKGLSHENMAHELDMSASAYNKLERSETILSLERLLKITNFLEIPLSDIFEMKSGDTFNQELKDNSVGYQELKDNAIAYVENLYQENKEINEKFIKSLQDEIIFLRNLLNKV